MCGIIGYCGPREASEVLLAGLKRLEYRGYDSSGIAVIEDGSILIHRKPGKISALEEKLEKVTHKGTTGIGHTRWATHGKPTQDNAHPHRDCTGEIAVTPSAANTCAANCDGVASHIPPSAWFGRMSVIVRLCAGESPML